MTGQEIEALLKYGAIDKARKHLKRLAIPQRMKLLQECIPTVNGTTESLKFFKENFSVEIKMRRCAKSHTMLALQQAMWFLSGSQSWTQHLNAESVLPPAGQQPESLPWTKLSATKTAMH